MQIWTQVASIENKNNTNAHKNITKHIKFFWEVYYNLDTKKIKNWTSTQLESIQNKKKKHIPYVILRSEYLWDNVD